MSDLSMRRSRTEDLAAAETAVPLREDERNRLLRRADWRFLLPDVRPGETVCFAKGTIASASRAISKSFVDASEHTRDGSFDLAVALDPPEETLREAFACLKPGGALYAEWRLRRLRGPSSIRRRLAAAGFPRVSLYWPRPDPETAPATIWLPLERTEVLRYYLDNRPRARNPARKLARAFRRPAFLPRPRFNLAAPVSSVAIRPARDETSANPNARESAKRPRSEPPPAILEGIRERWSEWGQGASPPETLSMLLITRGLRASGKAVALVFADDRELPVLAVKMPRIPESAAVLRREVALLEAVRDRVGPTDSIPTVLAAGDAASTYRVVETAVRGLPAFVVVDRDNFRTLALQATHWLVRLAVRHDARPRSQWWPRLVEPLLAEFEERFGSAVEPELLRDCRRVLDGLGSLPIVWEQRDFSPWNVFVDRSGEIAAVDWESAEPEGLPLRDLVYFLTYFCFSIDRAKKTGRFLESYRASLDPSSWTGRVVEDCIDRYSREIGLERATRRPLRILTWLLHSRSEYAELIADAGAPPSKDILQRSLFLRLWKEEVRGSLQP